MEFDSAEAYITRVFSDLTDIGRSYRQQGAAFRHHGAKIERIFDIFFRNRFPGQAITVKHIVAFFLYRVLGEGDMNDIHSGSVSLAAFFPNDLYPLLTHLNVTRQANFDVETVRRDPEFREMRRIMKEFYGDISHTSSRIIWWQDEVRLRSCFNLDTSSKQDEAVFVLLLRSGFRTESISEIRLATDVYIEDDGTVVVTIPRSKTSFERDFRFPLVGDDAKILRRWIYHRREIFQQSPYLFLSRNGGPISCNHVTQMIGKLAQCAGYGFGFFTAHSFRRAYANRLAAEVFAAGGSVRKATEKIADGVRWHIRSKIAERYIDPILPTNFSGGRALELLDLMNRSPEDMHRLRNMGRAVQRPILWFEQPSPWVADFCHRVGVVYTGEHTKDSKNIGYRLMDLDDDFRELAVQASGLSEKHGTQLLAHLVQCLLEDRIPQTDFWLRSGAREFFLRCVIVYRYTGATVNYAMNALQTKTHPLYNRVQALRVLEKIAKCKYDRRLHLGRLPDKSIVLLRVLHREKKCQEALYPVFDIDLSFPEISHDISDCDTPPQNIPDVNTPDPTRIRTPSTAASTSFQTPTVRNPSVSPLPFPRIQK